MRGRRRVAAPRVVRAARPVRTTARVMRRAAAAHTVRRGVNTRLAQGRAIRRQATRVAANKVAARPRPIVRPVIPVRRVMPAASRAVRRAVRPRRILPPSPRRVARASAASTIAAAAATAGLLVALKSSSAHPDLAADVSSLDYSLQQLDEDASLSEVQEDIAQLDSNLNHALSLLESARDKGYKYEKDLEDIAYQAMSRWQEIRDDVDAKVGAQSARMDDLLKPVNASVQKLNGVIGNVSSASPALREAQNAAAKAAQEVRQAESVVESSYADIESKANQITSRLTRIHWMLTQIDEATFDLEKGEDLVRAVAARWDQEGKDDPEGVLYLTNKRMLFERKEKIATKKVLFITTASELAQEVLIDVPLDGVKALKAQNKGLFGHQDFLDVEFSKFKPAKVSLHLNGQDSEEWTRLVKDAKSGKIEDDRYAGGGLSYADLTGPLTTADIVALQGEVDELQDEMMLAEVRAELAELENEVRSLERDLVALRNRGYAVEKSLEADVQILAMQWDRIKSRAEATLEYQAKLLGSQMDAIRKDVSELAGKSADLASARPLYVRLKSAVASAEAQAEAAEETVLNQYDQYADEVEALGAHFEWVDWMLDAISTASFQLLATESGVAATEAIWARPSLDPENGVLFLTDQRLLWEDRVGDFELKFDVPLQKVGEVKTEVNEEQGTEALVAALKSGAPVDKARFVLPLPVSEEWLQMIGRARAGDYSTDRAVEIDKAELDRIRNAPQQCSNCGAAFTAPILRGQTEITCEYCGVVTRL